MGTAVARAKIAPNLPADLQADLNADALALKDRLSAPSGDVIRMKNHAFVLPGSENSAPEITGVIIDWVSFNELYEGAFNKADIKPPVCVAVGLEQAKLVPASTVGKPVSPACDKCPKNQWKSDPNGKGKACKNQYLVALVPPDDIENGPILLLKVPPNSLKYFDKFARTVSNSGGPLPHPISVIARISFDTSVEYNSPMFAIEAPNPDIQAAAKRRKAARVRLLTEPEIGGK